MQPLCFPRRWDRRRSICMPKTSTCGRASTVCTPSCSPSSGATFASGDLFLFLNRRLDRIKLIHWDRDGLVIWMKRLESGTFQRPRACRRRPRRDGRDRSGAPAGGSRTGQREAPPALLARPGAHGVAELARTAAGRRCREKYLAKIQRKLALPPLALSQRTRYRRRHDRTRAKSRTTWQPAKH